MNFLKPSLFLICFILMTSTFAGSSNSSNLTISPIIGVEKIQQLEPTPSMKTRTIFGATALYKLPIAAVEAEYTHGQNTSYEATTLTSYKDVGDKVKLGLRGTISIGPFLSSYLRGGAQGKQTQLTKTVNGTSTTKSTKTKVNPYAGTGLAIHLFQAFSLNADVTAVYTPTTTPGLSNYEIQPSVGFSLSI